MEQYRTLWEQRLDRLEDYLLELQGKPVKHKTAAIKTMKTISKGHTP